MEEGKKLEEKIDNFVIFQVTFGRFWSFFIIFGEVDFLFFDWSLFYSFETANICFDRLECNDKLAHVIEDWMYIYQNNLWIWECCGKRKRLLFGQIGHENGYFFVLWNGSSWLWMASLRRQLGMCNWWWNVYITKQSMDTGRRK